MQQSYHGGSDVDAFHRTNHRNMAHTAHYDRATPYGGYYEPRHEIRQTYSGRIPTHTSIHEPDEPLTAGGQARRRIAVAVSTRIRLQSSFVTDLHTSKSADAAEDARLSALVTQETVQDVRLVEALVSNWKTVTSAE